MSESKSNASAVAPPGGDLSREHLLEHIADLNRRVRNQRKEIAQLRRRQSFDRLSAVAERVIEAAKWLIFCPVMGGYRNGRSVEDCCEELGHAVNAYFGTDIEAPVEQWWGEEELDAALAKRAPTASATAEKASA